MAMVLINGKPAGTTPLTVQLPKGAYNVTLEKVGYMNLSYKLNVDRNGSSNFFNCLLQSGDGA
jgi:hypothetical protein